MTFESLLPDLIRGALALLGIVLAAIVKKAVDEYWPHRQAITQRLRGRMAEAIIPISLVMAALYAGLLMWLPGPVAKVDLLMGLVVTACVSLAFTLRLLTLLLDALKVIAAPRDASANPS